MHRSSNRPPVPRIPAARRGQALVEFGIIAFVFTLLIAGILTFGLLLHGANVIQQAADVGAMEFSRFPASPTASFDDALSASGLFEEAALVVQPGTNPDTLPLINRLLYPVYIYDPDIEMVRYPGTLVTNGSNQLTVLIAIIGERDPETGVETISEWRRVVEEITSNGIGPYSITSSDESNDNFTPGIVALRINYPFQSAAMVAYMQQDTDGNPVLPAEAIGRDDIVTIPIQAIDSQVDDVADLTGMGYNLAPPAINPLFGAATYRGAYGLGEAQAFATTIRPYRKVLSAQGIYRREVYAP